MRFWKQRARFQEDALGSALDASYAAAVREAAASQAAIVSSLRSVDEATKETKALVGRLKGKGEAFDRARNQLQGLANGLTGEATTGLAVAEAKVGALKTQAKHFSVALFGRTMAGKSTVREALTQGDGATIGKGAQNTTRKTKEYTWNRLRILDAPGIATADDELREALDQEAANAFQRADLVIFMLSSDGIQQDVFRGLGHIRDRAKPVLFVLNYKLDLTKGVYRRRFVRNGGLDAPKIREAIKGHENRLRGFAVTELGMDARDVRVIPIHAQAAFLGRHGSCDDERQLLELSRIAVVRASLVDHVVDYGRVRRAQTMLDTASFQIGEVAQLMRSEAREIQRKSKYTKDKFSELDDWLDGFIDERNRRALDDAQAMVARLRRSVSSFVDDNIERKDIAKRWKRQVESHGLQSKMRAWQASAGAELTEHLEEFARQIDVESSLNFKVSDSPDQYNPWDVKRGLGWVSAGSAAATSVLIAGAALNWWNPAGWVMGALAGVSIVAGVLSWFSSSRESKLAKRRAEASEQLRDAVDDMAHSISKGLKSWFYESVTQGVVQPLRAETRTMCFGMDKIGRKLFGLSEDLLGQVDRLDRRLLCVAFNKVEDPSVIVRAARQPGLASKVLATRPPPSAVIHRARRALGERIGVVLAGEATDVVAGSLEPADVRPGDVRRRERDYLVKVEKSEMGRAIGRKGVNVKLAGRLVERPIKLVEKRGRQG